MVPKAMSLPLEEGPGPPEAGEGWPVLDSGLTLVWAAAWTRLWVDELRGHSPEVGERQLALQSGFLVATQPPSCPPMLST